MITGFTFAAAFTIAISQFKAMLGVPGKANEFLETVISIVENITKTRKGDAILGFGSCAALLLVRVGVCNCTIE